MHVSFIIVISYCFVSTILLFTVCGVLFLSDSSLQLAQENLEGVLFKAAQLRSSEPFWPCTKLPLY